MNTLTEINTAALNNPEQLIAQAEQEYHRTVLETARQILHRKGCKIVLLAGPSASGKTTTAHILCDALAANGVKAAVVETEDKPKRKRTIRKTKAAEED